jgi:sortase A
MDNPLVNGKPDVEVSVTQNWNPGGGEGVYNDHAVGVRYDSDREMWAVYNGDRANMPEGASFNVTVSEQARTPAGEVASTDTGEAPEYRDFYSEGNPQTPEQFVSTDSSAGAIPVVTPFNFGRNPGGPEDKTLSLDIPKLGIQGIPAFDTVSEEKLRDGTVHIPATGYPWQEGANVFIAGHRIGFEGTLSSYVFYRLDELVEGDEIRLQDTAGREYLYRVTKRIVVGPDAVDVMNAVDGKSLITLQTCTLPDYKERLIVQGELVEEQA